MADIRGQAFLGALEGVRTLHGDAGREAIIAALNPELKLLLDSNALLAAGFYPLAWYSELTHAIAARWGKEANVAVARAGMRHDVTTFARFILGLASPSLLLPLSSRLMRLYYRGARVEVRLAGPGHAVAVFDAMHGVNEGTWDAVRGALIAFVELSGGEAPTATLRSGGGVLTSAELDIRWG